VHETPNNHEDSTGWVDQTIQDGWNPAGPKKAHIKPIIAQQELVGKPFNVTIEGPIKQSRRVRIVQALDETTGQKVFIPAKETPIHPSDLPHNPLQQAISENDPALEGSPKLSTARKKGASTPYIDTKKLMRKV